MKQVIVAFAVLLTAYNCIAQVNIGGDIEKGYRDFVQQTRSALKTKELSDFASLGGTKRFFSNNWETGMVVTGNGLTIGKDYKFNYDFLDKELYALYNDTIIAVNQGFIASFCLQKNNVTHFFVKVPQIDETNVIESLGYDSSKKNAVQVLKSRTSTLVKGDKNSYLANFNGDYADNIKDKSTYYLYFPDGTFTKVKLDKKNLSASLKNYLKKAEPFFESTKDVNDENIAKLLSLINS